VGAVGEAWRVAPWLVAPERGKYGRRRRLVSGGGKDFAAYRSGALQFRFRMNPTALVLLQDEASGGCAAEFIRLRMLLAYHGFS
jgi:hypothetical protein